MLAQALGQFEQFTGVVPAPEALRQLPYDPEDTEWRTPLPATVPPKWLARRIADVRFTRQYLLPWIGRRLTGRSSGDGMPPKRPDLLPYDR